MTLPYQTGDPRIGLSEWNEMVDEVNGPGGTLRGDGTDEAQRLRDGMALAVAQGVPYALPAGKIIRVASRVDCPAGLTMYANGSEIRSTVENGDFVVTFASRTTVVGHLQITAAPGTNVRGFAVVGATRVRLGSVAVAAQTLGAGVDNLDVAVLLATSTDVRIGLVSTANFDYPVKIDGCQGVNLGVDIVSYIRGLYITDSKDVRAVGVIREPSPNATVSPGHNGVLISATTHDATSDITLDLGVRDAGEHGFRIGGNKRVRRVRFDSCSAVNVGGCGFKVLGGNATDANHHEDITFYAPIVEDAGQTPENAAGIMLQFVRNVQVISPIVRKGSKPFAAGQGIEIQAAEFVTTSNPTIRDTMIDGYAVRSVLGDCREVRLVGGEFATTSGGCLLIDYTGRTFRGVSIEGWPTLNTSDPAGWHVVLTNTGGTGAIIGPVWVTWQSVNVDRQVTGLLGGYFCDARATMAGSPGFRDGSTWMDYATGQRKVREAGAWKTLVLA